MNEVVFSNTCMPIVAEFGLLAASEPFYHSDRIADFNVMIYVKSGTVYVTEDEMDYEINSGEILFLKSGVHHWGKYKTDRGTRWYYVHFYLEKNNCIRSSGNGRSWEFALPKKIVCSDNSRAAHMIEMCNDDFFSDDPHRQWSVNARFFDILTEIVFLGKNENTGKSLSERICAYLSQHCGEPFSAKALEKEFYLSYKYMAAVFKKEQNTTMQHYHTGIRINAACRLLRSTLMSVSEVAAAVGYNDALYFSRCFRSVMGVSPSVYRRDITLLF